MHATAGAVVTHLDLAVSNDEEVVPLVALSDDRAAIRGMRRAIRGMRVIRRGH